MYRTLDIERAGERATLRLNRPEKMNALSSTVLQEIIDACAELNQAPAPRVVVIAGRGRSFSAGADLEGFPGVGDATARDMADLGRRMAEAVEGLSAITIARIQGWCVGGGVVLAAACDLRIATVDARFSIPEVDLGIPLAWGGIPRLVREIGPALAKELVITCRPFGAEEAKAAGFLNHCVSADQLDTVVDELATTISAKPRFAVEATKRHVDAVTATQVGLARSWADADSLLTGLADPEGIEAREAYLTARKRG